MVTWKHVYRQIADKLGCSDIYVRQVDMGLVMNSELYRNVRKALDSAHRAADKFRKEIERLPSVSRKAQAA